MELVYEPDAVLHLRPIAGALFYPATEGAHSVDYPVKCLLDTGSSQNFLRWDISETLGVDLDAEADGLNRFGLGGQWRAARVVECRI